MFHENATGGAAAAASIVSIIAAADSLKGVGVFSCSHYTIVKEFV